MTVPHVSRHLKEVIGHVKDALHCHDGPLDDRRVRLRIREGVPQQMITMDAGWTARVAGRSANG